MKVRVIGAGLIGGSIGLALKHAGHVVELRDIDSQHTAEAREATLLNDVVDLPDVVVVAVSAGDTSQVIADAIATNPKSVVIDVASIKSQVISDVEALIGQNERYVPTHPMAGKESSGAQNATFDLFADRIWVLTPLSYTSQVVIDRVKTLIADCGAIPFVMDSQTHDETVAVTSHVPQVISSLLAKQLSKLPEAAVVVSGQGLRDMTRLAASNADLWTSIVSNNAQHVAPLLKEFAATVSVMADAIAQDNKTTVHSLFVDGNQARKRVPGKHGAPEVEYVVVPILIDDKPGQLAGIFNTAGNAHINIEEVRIDHSLGKAQAVIELSVQPQVADALISAMRHDGWIVRSIIDAD